MSNFEITYDSGRQTTFAALLERQNEGYSVLRSPHAQLSTTNLGLAMLGFTTVVYGDSYIGSIRSKEDRNNPLKVGGNYVAAEPGVKTMTRFVRTNENSMLIDFQVSQAQIALGERGCVTSWHEYVANHQSLYRGIVQAAIETGCDFSKGVHTDSGAFAQWRRGDVSMNDVLDAGETTDFMAVAPLECKLACMFVAEAIMTGKERVYHLAGRDMMQYVPGKQAKIEAIIGKLQDRGFLGKLDVLLVPTAGTKVIAKSEDCDILNEMWRLGQMRDSESKKQLRVLLQGADLQEAMSRNVGIADVKNMGGEGVGVLDNLQTPISAIRHRLRSYI